MHRTIRLPQAWVDTIILTFKKNFGEGDKLWIFGSRVNLDARGGDIDLYVETGYEAKRAVQAESHFHYELLIQLGDQRIDIVINLLTTDFHLPIYDQARNKGVQLA